MEIVINKIKINYQDCGDGIPIVFIHGFPLNQSIWQTQIEGLSEQARIITLDLRGFGDSQATQEEYSMDLLANDLAYFLDSINVVAPIFAGLSMGGYVALAFCKRYARWLSGLVLIATRATSDSKEAKNSRDKLTFVVKEQGLEPVVDLLLPKMLSPKTITEKPEIVKELRKIMLKSSIDGVVGSLQGMKNRSDYSTILSQLDLPTMVIHGMDDLLISPKEAQNTAKVIPNAQLELIPDAGHMVNMEQPQHFNKLMVDFIQSVRS